MSGAVLPFRRNGAPVVLVKPIGGQFSATVLRRRDGSEQLLQVFPDPSAATRSRDVLNAAFAEVRHEHR